MANNEREDILMLPFMAQGHLNPFLQLAILLNAGTHYKITILTTPLNALSLRHKVLPNSTKPISIVDLPFDSSLHGLPPGIDNTDKLFHAGNRLQFLTASTSLEPHLRNFISHSMQRPPLCIICDHFMGWAASVAKSVGSFSVCFTTAGAYGTAAFSSFWQYLPHRGLSDDQPFCIPGFPDDHRFRLSQMNKVYRQIDGSDELSRYFRRQLALSAENCCGWLCNTVEEFEPLGLDILRSYAKLPVWAVGPLIQSLKNSTLSSPHHDCIIQWLNIQKPESVLYISFGSQNTISSTDMMELAAGLELCGKAFMWVIRPPSGFDNDQEIRPEWLPEGFEERMKQNKQGMLVRQWGPQMEILKHPSTGGFLSHCGWNSVLESLREGVPIIGWPLAGEQLYNLRMLKEEMGVAIEFESGVCKKEISRVVEIVLDREEGSFGWKMKNKAVEMGNKLKDAVRDEGDNYKGSSIKAIEDFARFISSTNY